MSDELNLPIFCGKERTNRAGPFDEAGVFSAEISKCQQDSLEIINEGFAGQNYEVMAVV